MRVMVGEVLVRGGSPASYPARSREFARQPRHTSIGVPIPTPATNRRNATRCGTVAEKYVLVLVAHRERGGPPTSIPQLRVGFLVRAATLPHGFNPASDPRSLARRI